jgi:ATP-dependent helicase/nuclease subunit A
MLQPQGEQAASNILKIIDQARAFTAAKRAGGLRSFVRWLKENIARASDETDASITEETDDAVRIITVHMSKGLEFGVVIFANMSADRPDWTNVIVERGRFGGAFHVRFGPKESGYRTPGYDEAEQTEQAHARAEQVRLLYVAATRARDYLITPFFHYEGLDPHKSVAELKSLNDHFRSVGLDESENKIDVTALPPIVGTVDPIRVGAVTTDDEQLTSIIEDREAWQAERQVVLDVGSAGLRVHTATSLKAQWEYAATGEEEVKRGDATEFGSAVHEVLERIDLAEPNTARDLAMAVATQCGMKDRVDEMVQCVENVVAHDVMKRALSSPRMLREVAFTAPLPDADDSGLAEGRMDLLFLEDGELVVVDFKTDRVDESQAPGRAAMYRNQALVYAWAAGRTTGIPVREVVFLFARGPATFSYKVDAAFLAEAEGLLRGAPVLV